MLFDKLLPNDANWMTAFIVSELLTENKQGEIKLPSAFRLALMSTALIHSGISHAEFILKSSKIIWRYKGKKKKIINVKT